jgi:hypothetical protein
MAETKTASPTYETGYVTGTVSDGWAQWDPFEQVPELQWPASVKVFARMEREDGRVSSVLQAIGLPIQRTPWRVAPNGAPDEVVEFVANNLALPIQGQDPSASLPRSRGRFTWASHLPQALSMLPYGHAVFEQVYYLGDDGRLWIRKLAPRPQRTISKWNVALDGGLISIEQMAPASTAKVVYGPKPLSIPINRLVVYARDMEPGQWVGKSLLRPSYKHWLLKDELMRIEAAGARRNAIGLAVGTAANPDDPEEVREMQKLASSTRAGMNSGVGLANGQTLELKGVQGNLPDIRAAIEYHDKQIALAGLAHFLNLDSRGGSHALATVQESTFTQSTQSVGEAIANIGTAHIVEDLVDLNFGPDVNAPRIVFDEIGSRQETTAAGLKMLVDAGLLSPDIYLEQTVRQQLGYPFKKAADDPEPSSDKPIEPAQVGIRMTPATRRQGTLF